MPAVVQCPAQSAISINYTAEKHSFLFLGMGWAETTAWLSGFTVKSCELCKQVTQTYTGTCWDIGKCLRWKFLQVRHHLKCWLADYCTAVQVFPPPECVYIQHSKNSSCVVYLSPQSVFNQGYLFDVNVLSRFIQQSQSSFPLNRNNATESPWWSTVCFKKSCLCPVLQVINALLSDSGIFSLRVLT